MFALANASVTSHNVSFDANDNVYVATPRDYALMLDSNPLLCIPRLYINARYIFCKTGISPELKLLAMWQGDDPLHMGISGNFEAIFLKLWDREKVNNFPLVEPHLENPKVPNM